MSEDCRPCVSFDHSEIILGHSRSEKGCFHMELDEVSGLRFIVDIKTGDVRGLVIEQDYLWAKGVYHIGLRDVLSFQFTDETKSKIKAQHSEWVEKCNREEE